MEKPTISTVRDSEFGVFRDLDKVIWACLALLIVPIALAVAGPFTLDRQSYAPPLLAAAILAALAHYYDRYRQEASLAAALSAIGQLVLFTALAAPLSYVAASLGWPGNDARLAALDRALGLDWPAMLAWVKAHPTVGRVLTIAYASLTLQTAAIVMALAIARQLARLRVFVLAFMASALLSIVISAFLPADGIWTTYGLLAVDLPAPIPTERLTADFRVLYELRNGTFRTLGALGSEGIISFPSLHTAFGLIFAAAVRHLPYVRWIGLVLNALMLISVPVHGAHYFVDMLGGAAVAVAAWIAAKWIVARAARPREPAAVPVLSTAGR